MTMLRILTGCITRSEHLIPLKVDIKESVKQRRKSGDREKRRRQFSMVSTQRLFIASLFIACVAVLSTGCQPEGSKAVVAANTPPKEKTSPITTLEIEECGNVNRKYAPITVGVPFAKGVVIDSAFLRIFSPSSQNTPLQSRALSHWPDGSLKWALFDFQANVEADSKKLWKVALADSKTPPGNDQLARMTPGGVEVISGPMKLLVPNPDKHDKSISLFNVWLDRDGDGKFTTDELISKKPVDAFLRIQKVPPGHPDHENWLRNASDDQGTLFRAILDGNRKVAIEENGPLRAVVRIDGWHVSESGRKAFKFTIRVHAYKNSDKLRFQHTFVATEDVDANFVREMGMTFPFDGSGTTGVVGTPDGKISKKLNPGDSLSVYGIGDPRLYHFKSYKTEKKRVEAFVDWRREGNWMRLFKGVDPPGWAVFNNAKGGVAVAFRDFRNLHSKELRVDGDGVLSVYLWPERGGKCLDLRRRSQKLDRRFIENGMDPNGGRGIAKTHEWLIDYSPEKISDIDAKNAVLAVNEPLIPVAAPEYYAATKVFGEFLPDSETDFPKLNAALRFAVRYMRELRKAFGFDGMIDWGDISISGVGSRDHINRSDPEGIPFRGYKGWNNNDFGLNHGLFLHYLRTGDRRTFLDAEAMAMHVMDIDTEHYNPEAPET
ncbi:MAG: hypothetical protein KAG97_10800, partial [Victivallales bacterium]|nr:hypothetical protein [Victivallales bacterium]